MLPVSIVDAKGLVVHVDGAGRGDFQLFGSFHRLFQQFSALRSHTTLEVLLADARGSRASAAVLRNRRLVLLLAHGEAQQAFGSLTELKSGKRAKK